MQHIGGNHQIVAPQLDPLLCQWLLHVQELIGQERILDSIPLLAVAQRGYGDIAIAILFDGCLVRLQYLQDFACSSSRACTNLQEPKACLLLVGKQLLQIGHDERCQHFIAIV